METLGQEHPDRVEATEMLDHLNLQARSEGDEAVRRIEWQRLMEAKRCSVNGSVTNYDLAIADPHTP